MVSGFATTRHLSDQPQRTSGVHMRPVLSYAFSGNRHTGRTRLYKQCKSHLPKRFPELTFAFLGSPLGELPFPLLSGTNQRRHPTTILLECWAKLNEFSIRRLRPALAREEVPVIDTFGLDALLHATACSECSPAEEQETVLLHHQLVQGRLLVQNIFPPHYFIVKAGIETAETRMLQSTPGTKNLTEHARRTFIAHENRIIGDYFRPGNGQQGQFLDTDTHNQDELFELIVRRLQYDLQSKAQVA